LIVSHDIRVVGSQSKDAYKKNFRIVVPIRFFSDLNNALAIRLNISLNIHLIMAFKTITIKEDTYRKLLKIKRKDESFSDLLDRFVGERMESLRPLKGSIEFRSKDEMLKELHEKREEVRYQ